MEARDTRGRRRDRNQGVRQFTTGYPIGGKHAQKQQSQLEYGLASMDRNNGPVQPQSGRGGATRKFQEQFDENRGRKLPS